ncbi:hypothetical protein ACN28E_41005 [Archangium lansingense]|uniref:hypothetical protein n=1 Tax=Archangium lansingense TaxID=2995310 RepID=UPI003B7EE425
MSVCVSGDLEGLKKLLAHDVTSWADGGGRVRGAALNPVRGADAVARLFLGIMKKAPAGVTTELSEVNGWPAVLLRLNGAVFDVMSFETDGEHIHAIRSVLNPEKLARM